MMNFHSLPLKAFRSKLLKCYQGYLSTSPKSCVSVGVICGENAYIIGDLEKERERIYNIGSVSKTMTAHLILKLAEEGKLELTRPVSDYLTLKSGVYPTILELLTHTAGFGHLTPIEITLPA